MRAEDIAKTLACGRSGCSCGRRAGKGWVTHCPAHDDVHPSLDITDGDGDRTLVHCFAACSQESVITALREQGLWPKSEPPGVTLAELAAAKKLPLDFLYDQGWRDGRWHGVPAVTMPYLDGRGGETLRRYRIRLRGPDHYRSAKGVKLTPYGLHRLEEAKRAGYAIIVEGETDAATCWLHGFPCLAIPGANAWRPEWASHLEELAIYLWREPDDGGGKLAQSVTETLPDIRIIEPPTGIKDINELWLSCGDGDAFSQRMRELVEVARPAQELRAEALSKEACEALTASGDLLDRPDILDVVAQTIRGLGFAGDLRLPLVLYLAITSRLLPQPVNVALHGPSAAGKTFLVETVSVLFPKAAIYDATAASERAWVYTDEDFRHRFLIVAEAAALHNDGVGASILRSIAWGGRIAYDSVEKTSEGMRGRRIEKPGPTGVITTSTRPLEGELATRFLATDIPDDPAQTRAVLQMVAQRANGAEPPSLTPLVAAQTWLQLAGATEVEVPYARLLADLFPDRLVRARRDFRHLLTLIQAHALLYQRQRNRNAKGSIVATIDDYRAVYDLTGDVFAALATGGVTESVRETVDAFSAAFSGEPLTISILAEALGLHTSTTSRRVSRAIDLGLLVNQEDRPRRPAKLVPGEPLPARAAALPDPQEVTSIPPETAANVQTPLVAKSAFVSGTVFALPFAPVSANPDANASSGMGQIGSGETVCTFAPESGGYDTHISPCVDCGGAATYGDPATGDWWCSQHGPAWTPARRDGRRR